MNNRDEEHIHQIFNNDALQLFNDGDSDIDMDEENFEDALDAFVMNDNNDHVAAAAEAHVGEIPVARPVQERIMGEIVNDDDDEMNRHGRGRMLMFMRDRRHRHHRDERRHARMRHLRMGEMRHEAMGIPDELRRMARMEERIPHIMLRRDARMEERAPHLPIRNPPEPPHRRLGLMEMLRGGLNPPRNMDNVNGPPNFGEDMAGIPMEAAFDRMFFGMHGGPSRLVFDMVRQNLPCSLIVGQNVQGCQAIIEQCSRDPTSLSYVDGVTQRTPLHEAASRCLCTCVMERFVHLRNQQTTAQDQHGNTPLHLLFHGMALQAVRPEALTRSVSLLLPPPPPPQADAANEEETPTLVRNTAGDTPLHVACTVPEALVPSETIDLLIERSPMDLTTLNVNRQTPLHLHCFRRNASVDIATKLAAQDFSFILDTTMHNPLHLAATKSNTQLVKWLLRFDPQLASVRGAGGRTPLHMICWNHVAPDVSAVEALVVASPESAHTRDTSMSTPLHLHLTKARSPIDVSLEVVQVLAPYCLDITDSNNWLPLHAACRVGADASVISLLATPETSAARTNKLDTALSLACTANVSQESVAILLKANPDATWVKNQYGFLPLHAVCRAYRPSVDIVQSLIMVYPEALQCLTNAGETPMHLAHRGASKTVLHLLNADKQLMSTINIPRKTNVGNTPLHCACLAGDVAALTIENLASEHPEWIITKNKGGHTPLQILSRRGRIDENIVHTFYRLCGSDIFAEVDAAGHTALHSAMRDETGTPALQALIDSYPIALRMCTEYGDTPLHLACCRSVGSQVVAEIARASCARATQLGFHVSPLLLPNKGGQTPIGIAIEEYRRCGFACAGIKDWTVPHVRSFESLVSLIKILYYGPNESSGNLVLACVAVHRMGARLDPAFILQVIHKYPEEIRAPNEMGHYPLHIEASIPIEKMSLLDGQVPCACGRCEKRVHVLDLLMKMYPDAVKKPTDYPVLQLMIQSGRPWNDTFASIVRANPSALLLVDDRKLVPHMLERIGQKCGRETLHSMIRANAGSLC